MRAILAAALALLFNLIVGPVTAQVPQMVPNRAEWWRNGASLDMDFYHDRYMVSLTTPVTYTSLTQLIGAVSGTFSRPGANETATGEPFYLGANQNFVSRASTGTYFDSSGVMQTAAASVARADYDPLTHAYRGILAEPARTNFVSNSTMVGAVISPSTLPDNWSMAHQGVLARVVGTGTVSGMPYADINFKGTGQGGAVPFRFTNLNFSTAVPVSAGDQWITSAYIAYVSGSFPLSGSNLRSARNDSTSTYKGELGYIPSISDTTGALRRYVLQGTIPSDGTIKILPYFQVSYSPDEYVDLTLRFAGIQTEKGASPSSFIPTGGAPASRAADVYTGSLSGTYFDASGTLRYAPANIPRLDHDPSTGEPRGILIEEARTNLVKRSVDFTPQTNFWYLPAGTIVTNTDVAPDGTTAASSLTCPSGGCSLYPQSPSNVSGTILIFSFFTKLAPGGSYTCRSGRTGSASSVQATTFSVYVGNGWYRMFRKETITSSGTWIPLIINDQVGKPCLIWGAQIEAGAVPTSYIPTMGAAETRAVEMFSIPAIGAWFRPYVGTLGIEARTPTIYSNQTINPRYPGFASLDDNTDGNAIHLFIADKDDIGLYAEVYMGGSNEAIFYSSVAPPNNDLVKGAIAFEEDNVGVSYNGSPPLINASVPMPPISTLRLGTMRGGAFPLNSTLQRVWYMPSRQPDASLADYTRRTQDN